MTAKRRKSPKSPPRKLLDSVGVSLVGSTANSDACLTKTISQNLGAQAKKRVLQKVPIEIVDISILESESHFKTVFENVATAIAITLPDGRFTEVNVAFLHLFNYTKTELVKLRLVDLIHPDDSPMTQDGLPLGLLFENTGTYRGEKRYLRKSGEIVWCEVNISSHRDETGQVVYLIAHIHDVTARRNADQAMRQAADRKDEFLAMLGHELRNPLNAICHAVQIASESREDPHMMEWTCGVVKRQSLQLSRMVDDLLDVARINVQHTELQLEPIDLRIVLGRAQTVVRHLLNERGLVFVANDFPPLFVSGDEARLEQVFVNLLHNAVKFTPEGGFVRVSGKREGKEIVVSVTDSGIGISAEMVTQVFDLFRQGDVSLDRAQGGLGIGLTVVKSLVEMHGGSVLVTSPGLMKGSTVTVRLPHLNRKSKEQKVRASSPVKQHALRRTVRVLLVEDNPDTAEGLRRLLVRRNCEVRVARDGRAGVRMAREFCPEVFLLDLGLPGLDGFQMIRLLSKNPKFSHSLFIAISGYAQNSDCDRALEAGFAYHCAKPLDFPFLMSVIRARCAGT